MYCHKTERRASYLVRFGYIGSHFHGLQPNKGFLTAGGALHDVLQEAAGDRPRALQFSARTDAGVHALENYATFWFPKPFNHELFAEKLLHADRKQLLYFEVTQVPYNIHARANAKGKWYRYVIEDGVADDEWQNPFAWSVVPNLDSDTMTQAAQHLVGTHHFDAFRHSGCTASSTLKTITRLDVTRIQYGPNRRQQIHIDIEGSAFLRRMVRIIVGTLAQVGAGFHTPHEMALILASLRRSETGPGAPACGLSLMRVGFES